MEPDIHYYLYKVPDYQKPLTVLASTGVNSMQQQLSQLKHC